MGNSESAAKPWPWLEAIELQSHSDCGKWVFDAPVLCSSRPELAISSSFSPTACSGLERAKKTPAATPCGTGVRGEMCAQQDLKAPPRHRAQFPAPATQPERLLLGPGTQEGAARLLWAPGCGKTLRYPPEAPPTAWPPALGSTRGRQWPSSP